MLLVWDGKATGSGSGFGLGESWDTATGLLRLTGLVAVWAGVVAYAKYTAATPSLPPVAGIRQRVEEHLGVITRVGAACNGFEDSDSDSDERSESAALVRR